MGELCKTKDGRLLPDDKRMDGLLWVDAQSDRVQVCCMMFSGDGKVELEMYQAIMVEKDLSWMVMLLFYYQI